MMARADNIKEIENEKRRNKEGGKEGL